MDLSTIRTRLEHNQYPTPPYAAFENDVRTIFKNCYAFNPPGTAVNDWGHRLEAVFEHKWDERPLMFDDDSGDEDPAFSAMEQQLQLMQANLEMMKATKKAEKEQKRYQQMQQRLSAPKPAKKPAAPQPNPYAMSAYASAPPPMPRHTSGGGPKKHSSRPGGGGGGGATHKKKKKRHDDDSDDYYDDDDGGAYYGGSTSTTSRRKAAAPVQQYEEFVDFEMKRELAVKIVAFQDDQLQEAINIIRRGRPELLGAADQEIELDIDQLDQFTLLNLYRYVCPDSKPAVRPITAPARATADKAPKNGGGAGGLNKNQRKNLDEEKEAERIEMLEARLREFESTGVSGETPGAYDGEAASRRGSEGGLPSAVATGGDGDQASSDSSDGDSSDSDSDED
jgi:bromodomain-containing factor 1